MSGTKGAVAAGHPATGEAAASILREGGNAFDAVLAAMTTACVAEPVLCSLGGGGFLLAHPKDGQTQLYDFFAQTPMQHPDVAARDFYPVLCDFGATQQEFHIGMAAMATPGLVKGMFQISAELGRMPIKDIVAPAMAAARQGVPLNRLQAYIFDVVGPIYMSTAASRAIFESKSRPGELVGEEEVVTNPQFADLLEVLAIEGEDLFYRGEIAARISADSAILGGTLSRADFEAYEMVRRRPLSLSYRDAQVFTNPPPSTGGLLIAFALQLLKGAALGDAGSLEHLGTLVSVMALTNEARLETNIHEAPPENAAALLLDEALVEAYRSRVVGHPKAYRGTTHVSVVDDAGNAASLTLSNGEGCGYIIPDTGVMMNNMLGEEDINPHGFHAWPVDTRMSSMMAPSLMIDKDGAITALGSGGSNRIRTAILQVLVNILDYRFSIADAVTRPRVHFERDLLNVEPGFEPSVVDALAAEMVQAKFWDELNLFFGGVHAVKADTRKGNFEGVGDPRRGGVTLSP